MPENQEVITELTSAQERENFLNENNPEFTPYIVAPKTDAAENPVDNEIKIEDDPADKVVEEIPVVGEIPVVEAAPEPMILEIEPDEVVVKDIDWDAASEQLEIPVKGKDGIKKYYSELKAENDRLRLQSEQFEALKNVDSQVNIYDNLLKKEPEDLIRTMLQEVQGWAEADVDDEIEDLIESGRLNSKYREIKAELNNAKQGVIKNAMDVRQRNIAESGQREQAFQKATQDAINSITNIHGLSFSKENLDKVQRKAVRISGSKDFQAKLKDPSYIAELAFREATGKSLDTMLATKFQRAATKEVIDNFGNPSVRTAGGVDKPVNLQKPQTQQDELQEFLKSSEYSIGK